MARTKRKTNPVIQTPMFANPEQRIYKAGGYIRLSMEDSGRPGADTIETQKELVRGYIERQPDMELLGLYCDNGQTGTDFARPEFERLMQDIRAGRIDCIVVKDLSRFGRNYRETGNYLERVFPFLDVRFVSVSDQFDSLNAEWNQEGYIIPLKNIINEAYSKDISKKVGSAYAVKQRKGEFTGTWAAYGYRKCAGDPHKIEPDIETAPVVRDIFRWRLSGISSVQIARKLNRQGIPAPARYHYLKGDTKSERYANVQWSVKTIQTILTNEVYLGHIVQGRKRQSFCEGKTQQYLQKSKWIVVRNTHEPLIDEDRFRAVQKMTERQKVIYEERCGKRPQTPNILKGLVYCADCGCAMIRAKSVTMKGTKAVYSYTCRTHKADPLSCLSNSMPETKLVKILWDTLRNQLEMTDDLSGQIGSFRFGEQPRRFDDIQALYDSLTEEMAHAFISRIEIGAGRQISIKLRYQDKYSQLARGAGREAVTV